MIKLLLAFLSSFVLSVSVLPFIIKFFKKKSANQTILSYVEEHKSKNGTTTMGGVVFIISTLVLSFLFVNFNLDWLMVLLTSVFFGLLGFMDDFIKIKYKQNLGLRPYQKIIGQVGVSIIFAFYVYFFVSSKIYVSFVPQQINLNWFIIPFIMLVLISTTNSVNLTDGLDGLAGTTTFVYLIFFTALTSIISLKLYNSGETGQVVENLKNMGILSMIFAGSILGFLIYNTNKASIFMGDVGSLCLGGFVGASACLTQMELTVLILGFCFVFSAISVILQVVVYKLKKKRVFKMAPFHHHLQMSGLSEPKIVKIYEAVTICLGCVCVVLALI